MNNRKEMYSPQVDLRLSRVQFFYVLDFKYDCHIKR